MCISVCVCVCVCVQAKQSKAKQSRGPAHCKPVDDTDLVSFSLKVRGVGAEAMIALDHFVYMPEVVLYVWGYCNGVKEREGV